MCQKFKNRINLFCQAVHSSRYDIVVIPNKDPHQSEYLCEHDKFIQWLTGFTGSAATIIATHDQLFLWTDSRYQVQAHNELSGLPIQIHITGPPTYSNPFQWAIDNIQAYNIRSVGLDGMLFTHNQIRDWMSKLEGYQVELGTDLDLISPIFKDRPPLSKEPVFIHPRHFVSAPIINKLDMVREKMSQSKTTHCILSSLDDIAWVLNLRGRDFEFSPLFKSYCIIGLDDVTLFVDGDKINSHVADYLDASKVRIASYKDIYRFDWNVQHTVCLSADPGQINHSLFSSLPLDSIVESTNPVTLLKCLKNDQELGHIKNAMRKDGVALVKAFMWLEEQIYKGSVDEIGFANKLTKERSRQPDYHGISFYPIVGFNSNGAIVHYRPSKDTSLPLDKNGILLCDSGAQYLDGTTDITRTVCFDEVENRVKECYTLVLKGLIALSSAVFPKGTSGLNLDILARSFLWNAGLDYGHGTGHGVGYFLNVHEGPVSISPRSRCSQALSPGIVTSIEPGYYEEGSFGIRIENLVAVKSANAEGFLSFDTLTLFPLDVKLIQSSLLNKDEISWINQYHEKVLISLSEHLEPKEKDWLSKKCSPIFSN